MAWYLVFKNNLKRGLNKKTSFIITFCIPIFVVVLGICANYVSKPSLNIGVLETKQSASSTIIIQKLESLDGIHVGQANRNTVQTDMITGEFAAIIDFIEDNNYKLYSVKDEETINNLKEIVDNSINGEQHIDTTILGNKTLGLPQRTIAFVVLFLMITATTTASLIIKDKTNGTLKRFTYSPLKSRTYILGNIIYNFIINYVQFFVAITVIQVLRLEIGINYISLLWLGFWIAALATVYGTLMVSMFSTEMSANLSSACIALILSLIGGTFIPIDKMPNALKIVSNISPIRWFVDVTTYLEQGNMWFSDLQYTIVLIMFILGFSLIAMFNIKTNKKGWK